jgi:ribosome modulation factor
MTVDSKLWDAGHKAGYAGEHRSACPYPRNSAMGLLWFKGWAAGMQQGLVNHPAPARLQEPKVIPGEGI